MRNAVMRIREKIINTNDVTERKKLQKRNIIIFCLDRRWLVSCIRNWYILLHHSVNLLACSLTCPNTRIAQIHSVSVFVCWLMFLFLCDVTVQSCMRSWSARSAARVYMEGKTVIWTSCALNLLVSKQLELLQTYLHSLPLSRAARIEVPPERLAKVWTTILFQVGGWGWNARLIMPRTCWTEQ